MDGGGTGGHPRTQIACLEAPKQFFVSATQTFLLITLFLHIHLQVGVLLRELPDKEKPTNKAMKHTQTHRIHRRIWRSRSRTTKAHPRLEPVSDWKLN